MSLCQPVAESEALVRAARGSHGRQK